MADHNSLIELRNDWADRAASCLREQGLEDADTTACALNLEARVGGPRLAWYWIEVYRVGESVTAQCVLCGHQ